MKRTEITIYAIIIALLSISMFFEGAAQSLVYLPEKVMDHQFYRLLTHAFVHITPYHLLLDGAAFFMLYGMLAEKSGLKRTSYVLASGIGTLALVTIVMPTLRSTGYCGLSGIDHGLMAITSLEMIFAKDGDKLSKRSGVISLVLVIAKSIYEALSGQVLFSFMHCGLVGMPVAVAHIGGVLGGCIMFVLNNARVGNTIRQLKTNFGYIYGENKMLKKTIASLILITCLFSMSANVYAQQGTEGSLALQAYELRMAGKIDEAIELIDDTKSPVEQFELSRCYLAKMHAGMHGEQVTQEQAQKHLKTNLDFAGKAIVKAIKADPDNSRYYLSAARIDVLQAVYNAHSVFTILGLPIESGNAINNYKKALECDPENLQARQELMGLYDRLPSYCGGSKDNAEKQLNILVEKDPIYAARAQCEIQPRKTSDQKIEIWQKVINEYPLNAMAYYGLAKEYIFAGRLDDALAQADKAVELDSSFNMIYIEYAKVCKKNKDHQKAETALEKFLNVQPSPAKPLIALALRMFASIKSEQGFDQQAEQFLKQADDTCKASTSSYTWVQCQEMFTKP